MRHFSKNKLIQVRLLVAAALFFFVFILEIFDLQSSIFGSNSNVLTYSIIGFIIPLTIYTFVINIVKSIIHKRLPVYEILIVLLIFFPFFWGQPLQAGLVSIFILTLEVFRMATKELKDKFFKNPETLYGKRSAFEAKIQKVLKYFTPITITFGVGFIFFSTLLDFGLYQSQWVFLGVSLILMSYSSNLLSHISLAFDCAMDNLAAQNVMVRNKSIFEKLGSLFAVVFNRTGVITSAEFKIKYVKSATIPPEKLLELAAYGEYHSYHPIAMTIKKAYPGTVDSTIITDVRSISGHGLSARINGKVLYIGNYKLMCQMGFGDLFLDTDSTLIHMASHDEYLGCIGLSDDLVASCKETFSLLHHQEDMDTYIVTGDRRVTTERIASTLECTHAFSELLPRQKIETIKKLMDSANEGDLLGFVGDERDDSAALAEADIGISLGKSSQNLQIKIADILLNDSNLTALPYSIHLSRSVLKICKLSTKIYWIIKLVVIILLALGIGSLWTALLGETIIVICFYIFSNSLFKRFTVKI